MLQAYRNHSLCAAHFMEQGIGAACDVVCIRLRIRRSASYAENFFVAGTSSPEQGQNTSQRTRHAWGEGSMLAARSLDPYPKANQVSTAITSTQHDEATPPPLHHPLRAQPTHAAAPQYSSTYRGHHMAGGVAASLTPTLNIAGARLRYLREHPKATRPTAAATATAAAGISRGCVFQPPSQKSFTIQ